MFPPSTHSFFMVGHLQAMGVRAEPSLICTLPGACGLSSLRDEVQTFPGGWAHSWSLGTLSVTGHPTPGGASTPSKVRCEHSQIAGHTPSG